jgi:ATP-dependent DNA helicase RecG
MKRIGIVERSGRGVDKIYRGMLRFGRPEPDYGRTDANSVVLQLSTAAADEMFLQLVVEQENRQGGTPLPIDSLIVLATLREQKRLSTDELAQYIQRDTAKAKRTAEHLVEVGLVEAHGNNRSRSYTLSAALYRAKGDKLAYTRQVGFTGLQHEQLVLNYVQQHGRIQRNEVMDLCRLSVEQAKGLLKRLKSDGKLTQHGEKRGTFYSLGEN